MSPLIIGQQQRDALARLREKAASTPMDVRAVIQHCKSARGRAEQFKRMKAYTIAIPTNYVVTFSIETGHPCGAVRHLSMSVMRSGRVPGPDAVWLIAEALGFAGGFADCQLWKEDIGAGDVAINVAQPIVITDEMGTA